MKHFEKPEISQRYDMHRPQVHAEIIYALLRSSKPTQNFNKVADIACGTGHSLAPLLALAQKVFATDISAEMLSLAQRHYPDVTFYQNQAEKLPFSDGTLDAIFVGMAYHWFNQPRFLSEAARTLRNGGYLYIYNFSFPGVMLQNPEYHEWHTNIYWRKFPNPQRNSTDIHAEQADKAGLTLIDEVNVDLRVCFSKIELRDYLCTQSNIDAAIDAGYSFDEIVGWLDDQLSSFLHANQRYTFVYAGKGVSVQKRI